MTKKETAEFLAMVALSFTDVIINDPTINAWHYLFSDDDFQTVQKAFKLFVENSDSAFAPKPPQLKTIIKNLSPTADLPASLAWTNPQATSLSREAWRRWGGGERYGMLPDPPYCDDPISAQTVVSFAMKEFCDIYNSLLERKENGHAIEYSDPRKISNNQSGLQRIGTIKLS